MKALNVLILTGVGLFVLVVASLATIAILQ